MRVLHLSVYDNVGGAGKAAFRLNSILSSFIDSKMLVLHKTSNNDSVVSFTLFFEKVYIKILFLIEKFFE